MDDSSLFNEHGGQMDLKTNQKGQVLVEAVLLLVLFMGILFFGLGRLKQMEFVKKLTVDPWVRVSGMVECGTWQPCGKNVKGGNAHHPNNRIVSFRPK